MPKSIESPPAPHAFSPLSLPDFRWLWIAALASNIGTWAQEIGAGWQMAISTKDLDPSRAALMVALVQFASSIPAFLLTMPAGALADVMNRRKIMLAWQCLAAVAAASLAIVAWSGHITPWMILLATLSIGISAAITNPAWQTAMVELVPANQVPQAAALNSVSLNLSRTIGPAIGGLLVAAQGPAAAFTLNALSFSLFILVLWRWKYVPTHHADSSERVVDALASGLAHIRSSRPVHAMIVRTASYVIFASALWALLPLIARNELHTGSTGYGWLLASLGLGAVLATLLLPRIRTRLGPNQVLAAAAILYGTMMAIIAALAKFRGDQPNTLLLALPAMFLAGTAWLAMVVTINTNAQMISPPQFRGRVFACYLTVHFGTLAAGSLLWGIVAGSLGVPHALFISASGMLLGLLTMLKYRIIETPPASYSPSPLEGK